MPNKALEGNAAKNALPLSLVVLRL